MRIGFYLGYAWRSIQREGQRSLLAMGCIAFGVLSLVAMQLLAGMLAESFLVPPRIAQGGDVSLTPADGAFTHAHIADLADLEDEGLLDGYAVMMPSSNILLRTSASGRVVFALRVVGVAGTSPLVTDGIQMAGDQAFAAAIAQPNHAVLTIDLAEQLGVTVGDVFMLSGGAGGAPAQLTVGGIAEQVPTRMGQSVFYSLETGHRMNGGRYGRMIASAFWGSSGDTGPQLEARGWTLQRAPEAPNSEAAEIFTFMLAGAGILGLLIGGIGVANTMQVILARRTSEIATLKTIGYRQRDLLLLFGLETALLGLLGGILGVALGAMLSEQLLRLLDVSMPFLLAFRLDGWIVAGGLLTGILTAVIFGIVAIVKASEVRPAVLLRAIAQPASARTRWTTLGLYVVLLTLFIVLSSVLLQSLKWGVGVVAFGLAGLLILGLLLGVLLMGVVRIPVPGLPLLRLARRNLRHQPLRAIYALVALFVGVLAIGFSSASLLNAQQRAEARAVSASGYNLLAMGSYDTHEAMEATLETHADSIRTSYLADVQTRTTADSLLARLTILEGRARDAFWWNVELDTGHAATDPHAVYIDMRSNRSGHLNLGDTLHVRSRHGEADLVIAGFYRPRRDVEVIRPVGFNLLVEARMAQQLGGPTLATQYNAQALPEHLDAAADAIGQAQPQAMLVTKTDVAAAMDHTFRSLYLFVIAVAGLAFVAGAVLIANAVGLAMVERRREIGVFKAIGYTSQQVLRTVMLENMLLGLLSGLAGLGGVHLLIAYINMRFPTLHLTLTAEQGAILVLVSVVLAVASAAFVAWHPTHVRPLSVLRSE